MHGGLALAEAIFEDDSNYRQIYPQLAQTIDGLAPILKVQSHDEFVFGWDRFEFDFSQRQGYGRNAQNFNCP